MRLWHLVVGTMLAALVLAIGRDPVGRFSIAVFVIGVGTVVLGTASLLALFQSFAAVGHAEGFGEHARALAVSAVVLSAATAAIVVWLFVGVWLTEATLF
jgi:hypothetical protein